MMNDMKYRLDTDLLYAMSERISIVMRFRAAMKDKVDEAVLTEAANIAINRYPYFKVRIEIDDEGGYVLKPNSQPIVVTKTSMNNPRINSAEVNFHVASIDYEDNIIYFNLCHNVANGPGMMEWVLTTLYQYVSMKEGKELDCPMIRKPDSDLLADECEEINPSLLPEDSKPIWNGYKGKVKTYSMLRSLLPCLLPGNSVNNFYLIRIDEKELMKYIQDNDASPASLFSVLMFKAADKRIPKKYSDIVIDMPVSTARVLGIPNNHSDSTMHIHIRYKRDMVSWDVKKLCTMTRGNMLLQTDYTMAVEYWKKKLANWITQGNIKGLKEKRRFYAKHSDLSGMLEATANISYIGRYQTGELSEYVDSIVAIVDGEGASETMALNGEFMIAFLQKDKKERWFRAFVSVLDELGIKYKVEGPYEKNQSKLLLKTK